MGSHRPIYGVRPLARLDALLEILAKRPRTRVDAWQMMRTLCGQIGARDFIALVEVTKATGRIQEADGLLYLRNLGG
jgi:hypothetical protein